MKFFRRAWITLLIVAATVFIARAELASWAQNVVAFTPLEAALFRVMGMPGALPGGVVTHLRPPWEARTHLDKLIQQPSPDPELYAIRAREEECAQDYSAAEADWNRAAGNSRDKISSLKELADYYHRRANTHQEVSTLLRLGGLAEQPEQRFQSPSQQAQWEAISRSARAAEEALLPSDIQRAVFDAWIHRYPKETGPYQAYLDWAIQQRNRAAAQAVASRIRAAFQGDVVLAVTTTANLAQIESGTGAALAVYSKNFSPLWPESLRKRYFQALGDAHQLRIFLGEAQTAAAANPLNPDAAFRLFFYYEQQGRKDVADQQLLALLSRRAAQRVTWAAPELKTTAALFLRVADYDESARLYYQLYELPAASEADKKSGLSAIISMLLDVPEQSLHFANRDLSLYQHLAQIDRHPGFLNGILSLILNSASPEFQYQSASDTAIAYFHRGSASILLDRLNTEFPNAPQTPDLQAKLFNAYATYGQEDAIIRLVPNWLKRNPGATSYLDTALLLADAYASKRDTKAELALYDGLLTELANKSGHVPIGEAGVINEPTPPNLEAQGSVLPAANSAGRSVYYSRVLDRYISRLVQFGRLVDAIALLRKEIDQNPDDPGIYERLALFLEQNQLDNQLQQTYKDALNHFKDMSWASKLGRFYVRHQQYDAYAALAQQITNTFKGSELAAFLSGAGPGSPVIYRQVNLYAHKRFPHNLVFVRNLLSAYSSKATEDRAAYEELLRENWFYDSDLKNRFFEYLTFSGKLQGELAAIPTLDRAASDSNLAAIEFRGAADAWLTNYEAAAPAFARLASLTPGDTGANDRAISIERSLAPSTQGAFEAAIEYAQRDVTAEPQNRAAISRVGEIYADREMYSKARRWWNRVAAVQPGSSAGYLDSATVFWDYFQFKDALDVISLARRNLGNAVLFGYEAGAIYENQGDFKQAVSSYLQAALNGGSEEAKARLLQLARRKTTGPLIEQETSLQMIGRFSEGAFELRLSLLEAEGRRADIESMLNQSLPQANTVEEIAQISNAATRLGLDKVTEECLRRTVAMTTDPIEKLQARISLARFYESHGNVATAQTEFASLLNDESDRRGVIRAVVDFYWRQKEPQPAVTILESAANRAQPPFQNQLRREAAEKSNESGGYEEARRLLDELLVNDPYNGDLLAAKASTYSRQNDQRGLADFYSAELKFMEAAQLPPQDKAERIAALRRGYIMALAAVGQFIDALEQYQLVLNRFPEDAALASEVARFSEAHQLAGRLIAYYERARTDSSHDYRWPLVLARLETSFHHYSEAIAAYDQATYVRPDRADFFLAKADLQTRLLRFDDALLSYQKVYELSFHDVQYLADQAELYARLGKKTEAMRLLRAAYVQPHPDEPEGYVIAMRQAEQWQMFEETDAIFRELRPRLTRDTDSVGESLTVEAEALLALHRPSEVLPLLASLTPKRSDTGPLTASFGAGVQRYLTPSEKLALSEQIVKPQALPNQFDLVEVAKASGFLDIEAAELFRRSQQSRLDNSSWRILNILQSSRLLYDRLGDELQTIAQGRQSTPELPQLLSAAFQAYKNAGDIAGQMRQIDYSGADFARLFVAGGGDVNARLSSLAQRDPQRANGVVQYLITTAPVSEGVAAIGARGSRLTPLWIKSYTALTGLYGLSPSAWAATAFDSILGPRTVGLQLPSAPAAVALKDANWFYYAARYGDYLAYLARPGAEEYQPASVESRPAASDSYVELGTSYQALQQPARAEEMYRYALQLSPERADVFDQLALLALAGNRRAEAISDWRSSFEILANRVEKGPLSPDYWVIARTVLAHMNRARTLDELKPAADSMLRTYARRNGAYQFEPFLAGIFDNPADKAAELAWVIDLSRIPGMNGIIAAVLNSSNWIDAADRDPLYRAEIDRARAIASSAAGQAAAEARDEFNRQITLYARYLSDQKRWPEEWTILQQIQPAFDIPPNLLLTAAALTGHLNDLLSTYKEGASQPPSSEVLLAAASSLEQSGHHDLSLQLKEFEYGRELEAISPRASSWFGMAQVRFEQKHNDEAFKLIRTVTTAVGAPFENLPEAVRFLEAQGFMGQAEQYAKEWQSAEPWNDEARLAFAKLKADPKLLDAVRQRTSAPYLLRVKAARVMRSVSASVAGSDELDLLTHKIISPGEASQPFFIEARLDAADGSPTPHDGIALYEGAIALDPALKEPRLFLAGAAFKAGNDELGLVAFNSYQRAGELVSKQFTDVEQLAAEALTRERRWNRALTVYRDLLTRTIQPAKLDALRRASNSVRQSLQLERANLARSPSVTDSLTQPGIVKPKLLSLPSDSIAGDVQSQEEEQ